MKRILFLGNGFDLAHKLPTSYVEFLYVCQCFLGKKADELNTKSLYLEEAKNSFIEKFKDDESKKDSIERNLWINYFVIKYREIGEGWIDFEAEIKKVCDYILEYEKGGIYDEEINEFFYDDNNDTFLYNCMKDDLKDLIKILDSYLNVVNELEIKLYSDDVLQFMPTDVVSFNYTTTYERIYGIFQNIDYIHGKISNGCKDNSIVLGYNSFDDSELDYNFAEYIKYYQMVNNDINVNILESIEPGEEVLSMFFGHSLDETDDDIIRIAFEKSSKVFIMCKDAPTKSKLVKKLIKIYGERDFRNLCLSRNKIAFFIIQKDMKPINECPQSMELLKQILNLTISYDDLVYFVKNVQSTINLGIIGNYELFKAIKLLYINHVNTDWNQYSVFYSAIINRIIGDINQNYKDGNLLFCKDQKELNKIMDDARSKIQI